MYTAAYLGNFGFPDKNASGKRVLGNCMALKAIGYRVICIGPGDSDTIEYEGIRAYTIKRGNEIQRVLKNKLSLIQKILIDENICIIFLYGAIFTQKENIRLIQWCHKRNIIVIYDQVDWLDLNWHNPFRGMIRAINHRLMNDRVIPACDGVICISGFLAKYHAERGCKTVVIPPLSVEHNDELPASYPIDDHRPIRLAYAGTTSDVHRPTNQWKDRIDIMFEKLLEASADPSSRPFQMDIYGMTKEQYLTMFPTKQREHGGKVLNLLGERVFFHGCVPNMQAMEGIRKADFTVLIRDKKRATMAGFPTKVSESISCGTPVLCNDTSDIKQYVKEGKMGFVSDDLFQLLNGALKLSAAEIAEMKKACLNNPFHYSHFEDQLKQFVQQFQNLSK